MNCIDDGTLRASLDGELIDSEVTEVNQHLASCHDCRVRLDKLRAEVSRTGDVLTALAPRDDDSSRNPAQAYALFRTQFPNTDQRSTTWINRLFLPRWRPAWGLAASIGIVSILVGVTPVRSWAQRILAMLRVQKIAVVAIDPTAMMTMNLMSTRPS